MGRSSGWGGLVGVVREGVGRSRVWWWLGDNGLSLTEEVSGLTILFSHPLPLLFLSFILLDGFCVGVFGGLCLSMAFIQVMNFIRCLIPALVLINLSRLAFLPKPNRGRWLMYHRQSLRM